MYNKKETVRLQHDSHELLQKATIDVHNIEKLRDVLRFHEYRYYILSDPLISDKEYDTLYKALEELEKKHPDQVTPDSPTQRVAKGITASFPVVQHMA